MKFLIFKSVWVAPFLLPLPHLNYFSNLTVSLTSKALPNLLLLSFSTIFLILFCRCWKPQDWGSNCSSCSTTVFVVGGRFSLIYWFSSCNENTGNVRLPFCSKELLPGAILIIQTLIIYIFCIHVYYWHADVLLGRKANKQTKQQKTINDNNKHGRTEF